MLFNKSKNLQESQPFTLVKMAVDRIFEVAFKTIVEGNYADLEKSFGQFPGGLNKGAEDPRAFLEWLETKVDEDMIKNAAKNGPRILDKSAVCIDTNLLGKINKKSKGYLTPKISKSNLKLQINNTIRRNEFYYFDANARDINQHEGLRTDDLAEIIKTEYPNVAAIEVGTLTHTPSLVVGRVGKESEAPLDFASVLLHGSPLCGGRTSQLRLANIAKALLYPGQIIGAVGHCESASDGSKFWATELRSGISIPPIIRSVTEWTGTDNIHLSIASGPFASLHCRPFMNHLSRLVDVWLREKPHVVVILGPFLDATEPLGPEPAKAGDPDELEKKLLNRIERVAQALPSTQFVVLPHSSDLCHPFPLPQPALSESFPSHLSLENIHYASNPATLDLNGTKLFVTSEDVVSAIENTMIIRGPGALHGRQRKLYNDFLRQGTLFPGPTQSYNVSPKHFRLLHFSPDSMPHIFIHGISYPTPSSHLVEDRLFVQVPPQRGLDKSQSVNIFIASPKEAHAEAESEDWYEVEACSISI